MIPLNSTRWVSWGSNPRAHYAKPDETRTACGLIVGRDPWDAEESVVSVPRCPYCTGRVRRG